MLFRGAEGAGELMSGSDAVIERRFLTDLEALFPQSRGLVREIIVQRWPQGAPYSFPNRATLQPALTRPLGRVTLAGDYLDAAIGTASEAADAVEAQLDTDARA
jgi:oxygen-dependent protoporphyrinogen oxidase